MKENTFVKDLIYTLRYEKNNKIRSGVYGFTQRMMAYNSNKIEGSTLTQEQTESLFNTGTLFSSGETVYRAKDIEEMNGHFVMFNYMLDNVYYTLNEAFIKQLHKCLKQGVFEDIANGYNIGEYKSRVNFVGSITTTHPNRVHAEMQDLLSEYNKSNKDLSNICELHVRYEKIHPFQDGNGRTGRIILFKECLNNNITPFIIRDKNKAKYLEYLNYAQTTNDISKLKQYFISEQRWYKEKVKDSLIHI